MLSRRRLSASPSIMSAVSAFAMLPAALSAQTSDLSPRNVALVGGVLYYDNGYTSGTAGAVGMRFDFPGSRVMVVEPSLTCVLFRTDLGLATLVMPELQVQAEFGDRIRPFIGVGGGGAVTFGGAFGMAIVLSAGGGVRTDFSGGWGGRAEVRLRGFDSVKPTTTEVTIGVSHTF